MKIEKITEQISSLPAEAQKEVFEIVSKISKRYNKTGSAERASRLTRHKFVGLWKKRKDISNSSHYVREIRKEEWK